ncbi:MAG: methyltransferase, partial [Acidimicrobiia bacterium]|nr:methyltransferase [Acidimicrobiia bacterium]
MSSQIETNEWADAEHAQAFLDRREGLPRMDVGYGELLQILPANPRRVLGV